MGPTWSVPVDAARQRVTGVHVGRVAGATGGDRDGVGDRVTPLTCGVLTPWRADRIRRGTGTDQYLMY